MEALKATNERNDSAPKILRSERYQRNGLEVEFAPNGEPSFILKQLDAGAMLRIGHSGLTELAASAPKKRLQMLLLVNDVVNEVLNVLPQERMCAVREWYARTPLHTK
jgi:hypothetical protein